MSPVRILLVDDEQMLLSLLKRHLVRAGFDVVDATSAEAALDAVDEREWTPDLLIADETLPGQSGTALACLLLERFPRMCCLLCSGYPLTLDAIAVPQRGRAAILQKPYMPAALEAAVAHILDRS